MNIHELAEAIGKSEKSIRTNFPKIAVAQAKKGIFIQRDSKFFDSANFTITYGEPKNLKKEDISIRKYSTKKIENEKWISSYLGEDLQVSNMGRYRWTKEPTHFYNGSEVGDGYLTITYHNKSYRLHRVILQSFKPITDYQCFTVDHKNGIRSDNRLQNLEWATLEENIFRMMLNRKELNVELTRLIQKYSYKGTLQLLQTL